MPYSIKIVRTKYPITETEADKGCVVIGIDAAEDGTTDAAVFAPYMQWHTELDGETLNSAVINDMSSQTTVTEGLAKYINHQPVSGVLIPKRETFGDETRNKHTCCEQNSLQALKSTVGDARFKPTDVFDSMLKLELNPLRVLTNMWLLNLFNKG